EIAAPEAPVEIAAPEAPVEIAAPEAPVEDAVADESHEVPADEDTEVDIEIAEGDPSDAGDKVEGIIDEAKVEG
ncbi:MAG: hypothetical protein MUP36_04080, partial [Demequinaceae bacterium]|nr:hypothetical protein [Demequinaceae bacterium]